MTDEKHGNTFEEYKKAVKIAAGLVHGDPQAIYEFGLALQNGNGVPKDEKAALNCFEEAAELGYPPAMYMYATYLAEGKFCKKDLQWALFWALRAIKAGHPDCGLLEAIEADEDNKGMVTILKARE